MVLMFKAHSMFVTTVGLLVDPRTFARSATADTGGRHDSTLAVSRDDTHGQRIGCLC